MVRTLSIALLAGLLSFNVAMAQSSDADGDGHADDVDNCPTMSNYSQVDTDGDLLGDVCDGDADNDGKPNGSDPAPLDSSIS